VTGGSTGLQPAGIARSLDRPLPYLDSVPGMQSHGLVRALTDGLLAALLSALLAGPGIVPGAPPVADQRDPSSAQGTGMEAPPGPTASAALAIAPAAIAAPLAANARFVTAFDPRAWCTAAGGTRPPRVVPRSAPTILRV
jgi:hypothetical protein